MATKLRLQRHGKKGKPFFHFVVADERAKRDGKFIEKLGTYNPNTNPATIEINFDKTLDWVMKGAQPTDTVRALLSYKGIMYKKHLLGGVAKGAFSEAEADKRFEAWLVEKAGKIQGKADKLASDAKAEDTKRLAAEKITKEKIAAEVAAKSVPAPEASAEVATEEAPAETAGEEVKTEEPTAEVVEEAPVVEEVKEEAKAEEPKAEAPAKETKEEEKGK